MTGGIQYSAQLAWANTGTVISHRSFQSSHPVHLESPEWGGNPAGRGQWCPLRAAISSMLAVEAQAPLGLSQQCQEGWVPQVQAAHLGWDLLGFSSKHAWVNTRFCPSLRLSFTQTTPSCEGRSGRYLSSAPPLTHQHPQHSDSLAPALPAFVVRPLRMWETLVHFLSLLQKMQITSL